MASEMETETDNGIWTTATGKKDKSTKKRKMDGDQSILYQGKKFTIELGAYRTEAEVLAATHIKFPWMRVTRRSTATGSAVLLTKDVRTEELLLGIQNINEKTCSFKLMEQEQKRTYILMGVPQCVTPELLKQDDVVLEAIRMTKWDNNAKMSTPTDMVKVVLTGNTHPARFTRGYGSYRMRPFVYGPPQCFNCQKFGHHARTCPQERETCRYCAGNHPSSQCKNDMEITLKCANCGEKHASTSRKCPKMIAAEDRSKAAQKKSKSVKMGPAPPPTTNAWKKAEKTFIPTMADFPLTLTVPTRTSSEKVPQHNSEQPIQQPSPVMESTQPGSHVPSEQRTTVKKSLEQPQRQRPQIQHRDISAQKRTTYQQVELETINIALLGASSILKNISEGNRRLIPALKKMMEAALDAIQTLTV